MKSFVFAFFTKKKKGCFPFEETFFQLQFSSPKMHKRSVVAMWVL